MSHSQYSYFRIPIHSAPLLEVIAGPMEHFPVSARLTLSSGMLVRDTYQSLCQANAPLPTYSTTTRSPLLRLPQRTTRMQVKCLCQSLSPHPKDRVADG